MVGDGVSVHHSCHHQHHHPLPPSPYFVAGAALVTVCHPCCSFEFFAGDDVFLGAAAKAYAAEGQNWRRSYYLPTSADLAIMKMRQWLVSLCALIEGGRACWLRGLLVCVIPRDFTLPLNSILLIATL